jgi:hypothetical protein
MQRRNLNDLLAFLAVGREGWDVNAKRIIGSA